MPKKAITESDVIDIDSYIKDRDSIKKKIKEHKNNRRVHVGPHATFYFESFDTMLYQVQEMLYIERGGREQLQDELKAYNPLIPDGSNLKCTQMIEFPDEEERKVKLTELVDVENRTYIQIQGFDRVYAIADEDLERANSEKTSSVHFSRFEFTADMVAAIKNGAAMAMGSDHPNYNYRVDEIDPETQGTLIDDFA